MPEITRVFDILQSLPVSYSGGNPVFSTFSGNELIQVTVPVYAEKSRRLASALIAGGIRKGDRIAAMVSNRPEWNFLDMGTLLAGAVLVPVYPTLGYDNLSYIFRDAGIRMLFIENQQAYDNVLPILDLITSLEETISIDPVPGIRNLDMILRLELLQEYEAELAERMDSADPDELATLIYTSGTTGRPKGVMLSHTNILSNVKEVARIFSQNPKKLALSVLPLCHVYERTLNYTYQVSGTSIHYVQSLDKLRENLILVRPEIFSSVPRMLEKTYAMILQRGRNMKGLRKRIFFWALELGHRFDPWENQSLLYGLKLFIANILVYKKIKQTFGGRIEVIVSGSANLNPKIARFFWATGIKVMEGYGLTETSPVISVGTFMKNGVKLGTVGPVIPGVQVKIAQDGEILCKGPNVMLGYYNRPERTREVLDADGWLHTGDIGKLDDKGFLHITDRKKEMFKTSGGKYVAPQVLENRLKESPFIEFVMVVGENRNFPAALLVPNFNHLRSWCAVKGIPYESNEAVVKLERIVNRIAEEITIINKAFSRPEQIKAFRLLSESWGVDTGELSPTLKLQREVIYRKYVSVIDQIYEQKEPKPGS